MLRIFSLSLIALLLAACVHREVSAADRNIVLIVTDDMSPDAGCYGNKAIQTPHIDALAREGTRFTQAMCTTASCSASRSVILTGIHNHANAQFGHEHAYHHFRAYDNIKSLPVLLTSAGYRTARIGKLHVGPPEVFKWETTFKGNERNPVQMAENCRDFILEKSDKPFFLYFATADPHRSGGVVKDNPAQPNPFGNRPDGYPGVKEVTYKPDEVIVPPFLPHNAAARAEIAQYYQSISRIDQGVGRLVAILKEAGVYDNTLIVFTSDHGIAMPGGKTTLYDPGMTVPMIYRGPGVPSTENGRATDIMVSHVDLAPTLLDFAGVNLAKTEVQGRSYLQALAQEKPANWDEVYASHTFHEITMYYPMRVVRGRQYKLIWNIAGPLPFPFASDLWEAPTWQSVYKLGPSALYGKRTVEKYIYRDTFELYDLQADPDEVNNLATDPQHAETLAALKAKLKTFQEKTKDPWILKWEYE